MDGSKHQSKTVAEHIVDFLERREVAHVFGLCGHTNIAVLAALAESPIEFVTVRHEQIASHAADAYARVQGRASVVLSHLSPGLTNCATGVANAALDCIPMVVIAGDIPTHYYGKHPHQEVNLHADAAQWEIYRPFVKRAWRVDRAELMAEILEKAFHLAESGQPGPVLVNVPMDIFSQVIPDDSFQRVAGNTRALAKPSLDEDTARQIVASLATAERPVAYVGGGILLAGASEELRAFVDHMGLPVAHSLMGKGALRDDHPLVMGMTGFWGTELVNQSCLNADYIFAVGTRFKEADCSSWYPGYTFNIPGSKVIHIDIEPQEIGRNYPTEIGVVADAKAALRVLNRVAREIHDTLAQNIGAISVHLELVRPEARNLGESAQKHVQTAHKLARTALSDARDSIWNMRSQVLEKHDLAGALERVITQLTEDTGIEHTVTIEGSRRRLPPMVENNLLRIGQEAVTNACKHGGPKNIAVEITYQKRRTQLVIADDGCGFAPAQLPPDSKRSFGLMGMKERVELLGGKIDIQSEIGKGARVWVDVSD